MGQDGVSIWVALLLIHSALLWLQCQETFSLALDEPPLAVMLPQLTLHTVCKIVRCLFTSQKVGDVGR